MVVSGERNKQKMLRVMRAAVGTNFSVPSEEPVRLWSQGSYELESKPFNIREHYRGY